MSEKIVEQSFIVVQRGKDYEKVYQVGGDLIKAMCYQKALIASDNPTKQLLKTMEFMIKQEEIDEVLKNLNTIGRDRVANDEEEVYIISFPARVTMR